MKLVNKYLITFLASGLIIFPTFADVATDVNKDGDITAGTGNTSLINILINSNQPDVSATANDELPAIDFESTYNDTEPNDDGGSADSPGFGDDIGDVPIDGGISLLVGAGFAYGAARLRKKKEENDII
jgi:hypothetical protein